MMKTIWVGVATLASLSTASCNMRQTDPKVAVEGAYVRISPSDPMSAYLYFTIRTNNDPTKLASISVSNAKKVELRDQGRVLQPGETTFSPTQSLVFSPGGKHALLLGLDRTLRPGERLKVTFNVEPTAPITELVYVRPGI